MERVVESNRLQESSRWREFFQSVAAGLQVDITLLSDEGSFLMHAPEVCPYCNSPWGGLTSEDIDIISYKCREGLAGEKFITHSGSTVFLRKLTNDLYIVVSECSRISETRYPDIEQRSDSAQKLLHSFLTLLNGEIEDGIRAVELLAIRQINHIIIAMFHEKGDTVELALDLILSALIILLDGKGCWIEYKKGGKTQLLTKGDKNIVEDYLYQNVGHAVVEKIDNGTVHATIGVLFPGDMNKVSSLLPAMAQECLIAFEIEHLFRSMQSQLTGILGALDSAVLLFDRNNEVCYANSAAAKLLDCNPLDLIGQKAEAMNCPWTFAVTSKLINHVNGTMSKLECSFEDKWIDWQVSPVSDELEVTGKIVIADDRTQYYKWLEIGKKAERLATIATMIGPLAHHLRNPLAAAKGLVELMGQKKDPQKIMGYHNLILRELDRVICLLNEFLMLGKPALLSSDLLDLNSFLEELMPVLIGETSGTDIEIVTDIKSLPPVLADSGQLTQVVLNIISNSIEAVGSKGIIRISLNHIGDWVEISFEDNGPGIPDDMVDKIFEPFFTTKEGGTGLGLSIAQAIVNNHGGYIKASNSQDGGAVFTVRLPAANYSSDRKYRLDVMFICKDHITRSSMEHVLHTAGIQVISVSDLNSGFSMGSHYYPRVLVMEESFIDSNSIEQIRKIWPDAKILSVGKNREQINMEIQSISLPVEYSSFVDKVRNMANL